MSLAENIYHHGFHLMDNFLDEDDYQALRTTIQTLRNSGNFKPAKIGPTLDKTANANIRNDAIFWLDKAAENPAVARYLETLEALSQQLNQSLFLGLVDVEAHFAIYEPNNFYKKHVDQFSTNQDRRISCVYYLNENWQDAFGGELILYEGNDEPLITIQPQGNRLVCFNSDMPHEVVTTYETRYSITAWLKIRPMALIV